MLSWVVAPCLRNNRDGSDFRYVVAVDYRCVMAMLGTAAYHFVLTREIRG